MTEPKHTPGPWFIDVNTMFDKVFIMCKENLPINCGFIAEMADTNKNREADTNLIAAAPDMYEALEAYEKAEADIVLNANWNTPSGVPQITQEQFDMLIDCQTIRYKALRKARGATNL